MACANPYPEDCDDGGGFSCLRTSLKCAFLTPFKPCSLYRMRWQIELFSKANKDGSGLMSINSDNKHIILSFLLMGVMASLIKSFVVMRAEDAGYAAPGAISLLLARKGGDLQELQEEPDAAAKGADNEIPSFQRSVQGGR